MLDIIALFQDKSTLDELGIGTVRDALADILFPGINTIQTRARYFFLIPWIYLRLEQQRVPAREVATRARQAELALIGPLLDSGETDGVFGRIAGQSLQRLPSSIYWLGLYAWRIRLFPGSQSDYHRQIDRHYRELQRWHETQRERRTGIDGPNEEEDPPPRNWHAGLPQWPDGFPEGITFRLTQEEAGYLQERIIANQRQSFLAFLVDQGMESGQPDFSVRFPWELSMSESIPSVLRHKLYHARNFSECIHGASLLYNWLLAGKRAQLNPEGRWLNRAADYERRLVAWNEKVQSRLNELQHWDRADFWFAVLQQNPRVPHRTQAFVRWWLSLVIEQGPDRWQADETHQMIAHRELALKGKLARLRYDRPLEQWNGESSAGQLDFRWQNVRTFLTDLATGLQKAD